jgi:hypothetical protein
VKLIIKDKIQIHLGFRKIRSSFTLFYIGYDRFFHHTFAITLFNFKFIVDYITDKQKQAMEDYYKFQQESEEWFI